MRRAALIYGKLGFHVFPVDRVIRCDDGTWESEQNKRIRLNARRDGIDPVLCQSPGKQPKVKWKKSATNNLEQIDRWFTAANRGTAPGWPDANIGIATGSRSGFWVLDIDGHEGEASLQQLLDKHGGLPLTVEVITQSGGRHLWFAYPDGQELRNSASSLGLKLDTRGDGGYVVAPPSRGVTGNHYRFVEGRSPNEIPIAPAPEWLEELAFTATKANANLTNTPVPGLGGQIQKTARASIPRDESADLPEMASYLSLIGDSQGQAGFNKPIYSTACSYFARFGADAPAEPLKTSLLHAVMHAHVKPERGNYDRYMSDEYLDSEIENARNFIFMSQNQPQTKAANGRESKFRFTDHDELIHAINERAAVVWLGTKIRILIESKDGVRLTAVQDASHAFAPYRYLSEDMNKKGDKVLKDKPGFATWLASEHRREYRSVVFDPGRSSDPSVYNTYTGLGMEPAPGDWSKMQAHIFDIVCRRDLLLYRTVLSWMSQMVQEPGRKIGSALVLQGGKGTGKSILAECLCRIIGDKYATKINNQRQLTGQFNAHFSESILSVLEEGFWAGDHQADGVLKDFITSGDIMIERKGVDAEKAKNFTRLLITSNNAWVVPATEGERRFIVCDVSSDRARDLSYFGPLIQQMKQGGDAAMLHDLLRYEYSEELIRNPPRTAALIEQVIEGLKSDERWYYSMLQDGHVPGNEDHEWVGGETLIVGVSELRDSFNQFVRQYHGAEVAPASFGRFLKQMIPDLPDTIRPGANQNKGRSRVYRLPPLPKLRAGFTARYGISFDADSRGAAQRPSWIECPEAVSLFSTSSPSRAADDPADAVMLPTPANDQEPVSDAA